MEKQQKKPTISTENLFQLIQKKQYAQYKHYVSEVQLQNQHAEQAVVTNLTQILVSKKYKDPSICFNALVFYKMLVVGANMDFLCEDALFPQSIHRQLYNICIYKGTQKNLQTRSSHYFSELFGIPYTQQNGRFSYNYILLSLQLLKSLAKWYPSNYNESSRQSIFKEMFQKLRTQSIFFPQASKFALVKQADEAKFTSNYNKFKSYYQLAQNELQHQQTPQPNQIAVSKINKSSSQMAITKTTIIPNQKQDRQKQDSPSQLPQLKSKLISKQKSTPNKNEISMIQVRGSLMTKQRNTLNIQNQFEQFKAQSMLQAKKIPGERISVQETPKKKEIIQPSVISFENSEVTDKIELPFKKQSIVVKKQLPLTKNQLKQTQKKSFLQDHINKMTQNILQKHEIIKSIDQSKLDISFNANTQRNPTPKNMYRTQKRNMASPNSRQKNNQISSDKKSSSHKSLPKTQKRKISVKQEKQKSFKTWVDFQGPQHQKLKNTLSQLTSLRKEAASKQIDQYGQVASMLQEMKFDTKHVSFKVQHFKPLRPSMVSLRQQALNLADFPNAFNQFYTGISIEARLIKEGLGLFILSLRNISDDALTLAFKDMSSQRFSNHIKVLSWGNRTDFKPYTSTSLLKNTHLDIKFTVHICDYTLKFLPFDFMLNGEDCFFVLPITLLDMSHPKNIIQPSHIREFRLKGTTIASNPFQLRKNGLPNFLGKFCFKQFLNTKVSEWQERIVGGCRLQIPVESYVSQPKRDLIILVKVANYAKRLIQLVIIFTKRDTLSERFSLAFLQLLQFLLAHE